MTRLTPRGRLGSRPTRPRPQVELLEDRLVPATNPLANLNYVARVELDVLHHPLDGLGAALARRLDHSASPLAVLRAFEGTGAFKIALVGDAFAQVLGHGPDATGLVGGLRFLRHGGKILDLEVSLAGTDEFFVANGDTVDGFITGVYQVGLGRGPNSAEMVLGDAALTRGESRTAFARSILKGAGGLAFQADTVFVDLLRHHADGVELSGGVSLISRHGLEALIAAVLSSGEYYHLGNVHATHLVFLGQPGTQTAGVPFGVVAEAEDDLGQLDVTFNGAVTVGLGGNPAPGSLLGTQTQTATDGVVVFGPLSIQRAGSGYTLVANTPGLRGAVTGPFTVNPASADHLVFTEQPPSPATAGQGFTVQVTAEDPFGNVDTNYNGSVSLTIDPGHNPTGAKLHLGASPQPQDPQTAAADHGVATFTNVSIQTANEDASKGHYELLATSGGLQAGDSAAFDVIAAAASQLVFTQQPTQQGEQPGQVAENKAFSTEVTVEDRFNNPVTNYNGSVTVAIGNNGGATANNPQGGTLSGTKTQPVNNSTGAATFSDLSLDVPGDNYTLTATSNKLPGASATSASFNVVASSAQLVFTTQPPRTVNANGRFQVQVTVEDPSGKPITNYPDQINLALVTNGNSGKLSGTMAATPMGGVATFTVSIDQGGVGYTLSATSSDPTFGNLNMISNAIDVLDTPVITSVTDINGNPLPTITISGQGTFAYVQPGQQVILVGKNLEGADANGNPAYPTVTFTGAVLPNGSGSAQVPSGTAITGTKLTITVPAADGPITVKNRVGTSAQFTGVVTVIPDNDGDFQQRNGGPNSGTSMPFETITQDVNDDVTIAGQSFSDKDSTGGTATAPPQSN
jgi:hypothetical protein